MTSPNGDRAAESGYNEQRFAETTTLAEARDRLLEAVIPHGRTVDRPVREADAAVLVEAVTARRSVPGYEKAAMDGYAVRGDDTADASAAAPVVLEETDGRVCSGQARPVHTGSELPRGADTVVRIERTRTEEDWIEIQAPVPSGTNVAPPDEDVAAGEPFFAAGHRLRPPDLGLLRSIGVGEVSVVEPPRVSVVPTGEELVVGDPDPGEVVETNGLTVARSVDRWGGLPTYREQVTDETSALRVAIERDLDHDLVVTTGGTSVGQRDLLPDVLADRGDVLVHGVAIKPGHPVGFGLVEDVPVLMLPGYPVSTIVTAVQLLRPAIAALTGTDPQRLRRVDARLSEAIHSDAGRRTYERVTLEEDASEADGTPALATPIDAAGASVLSSVARADGWIEVPEEPDGIESGETVAVQDWDSRS